MGDCNTLKTFPNPHHCDPHLDQTKFNDLLPLTIYGVLIIQSYDDQHRHTPLQQSPGHHHFQLFHGNKQQSSI